MKEAENTYFLSAKILVDGTHTYSTWNGLIKTKGMNHDESLESGRIIAREHIEEENPDTKGGNLEIVAFNMLPNA